MSGSARHPKSGRRATETGYLLVNRFAARAQGLLDRIDRALAELPLILSTPALIDAAARDAYSRSHYYDGEAQQSRGFYPYEQRAIGTFFPKPPARVLAHGVGGGRQLLALVSAGYEVEAHEPLEVFAAAAEKLAHDHGHPGVRVETDSIQQWASSVPAARFDAVLLGWSTYSHLLAQADRLTALRAFRAACPRGPLLLSFYRFFDWDVSEAGKRREDLHPRRAGRLQRILRGQVRERWLRLPAPLERGTNWQGGQSGHFFHAVERWELEEEARESGYAVAYFERDPEIYPHAVLLPSEGMGA